MYEGSECRMKELRRMKKISYLVNIAVKESDEEEYSKDIKDTHERIDTYIEQNELHELIHCYIYQLFNIPSIIIYTFRFTHYFFRSGACCLPLKRKGIITSIILDILHTIWDLFSDFINLRLREKTQRTPLDLIKRLINDIFYESKLGIFKYKSLNEIKIRANKESLETIECWDQGRNGEH